MTRDRAALRFHSNDATGSYFDETDATWHAMYDCTPPASYSAAGSNGSYSWCEAISADLVHWTQAARAILPENAACDAENLETGVILGWKNTRRGLKTKPRVLGGGLGCWEVD